MPLLATLADIRDVFIIVYGVIGIVFFFVAVIVTLVLGLTVRGLIRNVNQLLDESVKPTLGSIRQTANSIRGTTEFVGQTAVAPIIRTYGMFAGARRAISVISGLNRNKKKRG